MIPSSLFVSAGFSPVHTLSESFRDRSRGALIDVRVTTSGVRFFALALNQDKRDGHGEGQGGRGGQRKGRGKGSGGHAAAKDEEKKKDSSPGNDSGTH